MQKHFHFVQFAYTTSKTMVLVPENVNHIVCLLLRFFCIFSIIFLIFTLLESILKLLISEFFFDVSIILALPFLSTANDLLPHES